MSDIKMSTPGAPATAGAPAAAATKVGGVPLIISVEGNIGSGKSTLLEKLRQHYTNDPTIGFVQEPVDLWGPVRDTNGVTILEKYYSDQKKYAFSFQMLAFISRLAILRQSLRSSTYKVIIIERSIYTDAQVFAKMLFDDKKIEDIEYTIYMKWFDEFIHDLPPIHIVYVRADPDVCFQRVIKRARHGEAIPLDYLTNCHLYHETWLSNFQNYSTTGKHRQLNLNANYDITSTTNTDIFNEWIQNIQTFIADSL